MEIVLSNGVGKALLVIVILIILDALFGIIKSIKRGEFDVRLLPQFVATGILPYLGGIVILAVPAEFVGAPFTELFYAAAAVVGLKYLAEVKDKIQALYGVQLKE